MPRGQRERVGDVLVAIADIRADTADMNVAAFVDNPTVIRSVLYSIGVIGEAVKAIDQSLKDSHPEIPWRAIAGLRDRVVHEYFRTSPHRIWDVVQDDLDPLEMALRSAFDEEPPKEK
jgi:uncharacterized protein with HEPN domain